AAGLIERRGGTTTLDRLGGLARLAPVLGVLFFLPALNLAGIPPFSGFLGKLGLLQAGVADGGVLAWLLVTGSVVTSLLTLYAIGRVWNLAFWREPRTESPAGGVAVAGRVLPKLMVGSTVALVVLATGLTLISGPLFDVTSRAAAELLDREPYVHAVFGQESP
ncbi:proton-conducting transporter membrane subunit, partial [Actinoplanes sp. GCM10030250]|uniref:proton-conducting transporter transmembrane domain-containing protein n=1 Tax=Actinoplanes sp. GCM10030250 TaxID=3273376 RepID=UPI00361FE6F2